MKFSIEVMCIMALYMVTFITSDLCIFFQMSISKMVRYKTSLNIFSAPNVCLKTFKNKS